MTKREKDFLRRSAAWRSSGRWLFPPKKTGDEKERDFVEMKRYYSRFKTAWDKRLKNSCIVWYTESFPPASGE
jgi:hypothetical protein